VQEQIAMGAESPFDTEVQCYVPSNPLCLTPVSAGEQLQEHWCGEVAGGWAGRGMMDYWECV